MRDEQVVDGRVSCARSAGVIADDIHAPGSSPRMSPGIIAWLEGFNGVRISAIFVPDYIAYISNQVNSDGHWHGKGEGSP